MKVKLLNIKNTEPQRAHGDIKALAESIRADGLICPLTLNQDYKLLAGRRRYEALRLLGIKEAECNILQSNGALYDFRVAIAENLERKPLTDLEVASAIKEYDELKRKQEGGAKRGQRTDLTSPQHSEVWTQDKTAGDLGISRQAVTKAIQIAKAVEDNPGLASLKKGEIILREVKFAKQREDIKKLKAPSGLYDVIVIDPPWNYHTQYDPDWNRGSPPYPTIETAELKRLKVPANKDCVLWLWVTNHFMRKAYELLDAWGFKDKTILTWVKDKFGLGHWLRNQTDHCILAVKGNPLFSGHSETTALFGKRTTHSTKPEEFYQLIDRTCAGRKLDYFSRKVRKGWDSYGDEIGK